MTNKELKQIQFLEQKKYRQEFGQFFIEGKRLVQTAIDLKADIQKIIVTDPFFQDNSTLSNSIESKGYVLEQVSSKHMEKLSFTKSPSGIAAVCTLPENNQPNLSQQRWIYLDHISDPGNMGTLFRSAAWFGMLNIALSLDCVDPFNPKVLRAGMGAHFGLSIHSNVSIDTFITSHKLIGADQHGTTVENFTIPEKTVLVLGSEAHGLSSSTLDKLHETVAIEKRGFGESLNVSIAGAILMEKLTGH